MISEKLKNLLIDSQLKSIDNGGMIIVKDNKEYNIDFVVDDGDWCGYAEVQAELKIDEDDIKNNPIIANVTEEESAEEIYDEERIVIRLFGISKKICDISCEASSGSGWHYGASVTFTCKELQIEDEIVTW